MVAGNIYVLLSPSLNSHMLMCCIQTELRYNGRSLIVLLGGYWDLGLMNDFCIRSSLQDGTSIGHQTWCMTEIWLYYKDKKKASYLTTAMWTLNIVSWPSHPHRQIDLSLHFVTGWKDMAKEGQSGSQRLKPGYLRLLLFSRSARCAFLTFPSLNPLILFRLGYPWSRCEGKDVLDWRWEKM